MFSIGFALQFNLCLAQLMCVPVVLFLVNVFLGCGHVDMFIID